jgi:hypothetical protein
MFSHPLDPPGVKAARALQLTHMKRWVAQASAEAANRKQLAQQRRQAAAARASLMQQQVAGSSSSSSSGQVQRAMRRGWTFWRGGAVGGSLFRAGLAS